MQLHGENLSKSSLKEQLHFKGYEKDRLKKKDRVCIQVHESFLLLLQSVIY